MGTWEGMDGKDGGEYCNLQLGVKGGPTLQEHAGHSRECSGHHNVTISTDRIHQAVEHKGLPSTARGVEAEEALRLIVIEGGHHRVEEGALLGVEEGDSCPCFLHLLLGVEGQPLSCKESLGVGDGRHCNRKWEIEGGEVLGVDQQLILQPSEEPGNAVWQKYLCNFGPVLSFCNAAGSGPVFNQLVPVTIIVIIISLMMENNNLWSE